MLLLISVLGFRYTVGHLYNSVLLYANIVLKTYTQQCKAYTLGVLHMILMVLRTGIVAKSARIWSGISFSLSLSFHSLLAVWIGDRYRSKVINSINSSHVLFFHDHEVLVSFLCLNADLYISLRFFLKFPHAIESYVGSC